MRPDLRVVTEVLDTEGAESLGLENGAFALLVRTDSGDLGRLALAAHTERLQSRSEDFGAGPDLPAAPVK